jgi:flagellar L-ring protein precursor FlgH
VNNRISGVLGFALAAGGAAGQSLYQQPVMPPAPPTVEGMPGEDPVINPVADLSGVSLYAVQPPKPRSVKVHDLITIIVNQSSKMTHDQSLDTDKKFSSNAAVDAFIDYTLLMKELQFRASTGSPLPEIDVSGQNKFEGDGEFEREDRVTARITAEVIDVKPNGTIVLEAKTETDKETQTMLLSGVCRHEDISAQNTVQSTQLFDLKLDTRHTGEVNNAAKKGILTKVLEGLVAF